jgi:hypothetical protein
MNPLNNPLFKPAPKPYSDNQDYYILIQGDYGAHDRPPTPHWVKVKYRENYSHEGDFGRFVSPCLPQYGTYAVKDVLVKDVSPTNLAAISYPGFYENTPYEVSKEDYIRYVLGEGLGEARPIEARNYHQGFLRGLEFAEKFL